MRFFQIIGSPPITTVASHFIRCIQRLVDAERRDDVINHLRKHYRVSQVVDYSASEQQKEYLEGTGSLVLDHVHKIVYASLSQRTHATVLKKFCHDFGYEAVTFQSKSEDGRPIYHTNVMMCVGSEFALAGLETVTDEAGRTAVRNHLEAAGKEVDRTHFRPDCEFRWQRARAA